MIGRGHMDSTTPTPTPTPPGLGGWLDAVGRLVKSSGAEFAWQVCVAVLTYTLIWSKDAQTAFTFAGVMIVWCEVAKLTTAFIEVKRGRLASDAQKQQWEFDLRRHENAQELPMKAI